MKLLMGFATILISFSAWSDGGTVGNGGGLAEQNIMYAYNNLYKFTGMCLSSVSCGLDKDQAKILRQIHDVIPDELKTPKQIEFRSEKETPGFFVIDGVIRLAKTGSTVGSTIYVNRDLLYTLGQNGNAKAMSIPSAAAMLTHEIGHHVGLSDELMLDLIGVKVKTLLVQQSEIEFSTHVPGLGIGGRIQATVLSTLDVGNFPSDSAVLFDDGIKSIDVTPNIRLRVEAEYLCAKFGGYSLKGVGMSNVHWSRIVDMYDNQNLGYKLRGYLAVNCESADGVGVGLANYEMEIVLPVYYPGIGNERGLVEGMPPILNLIDCNARGANCY